MRFLVYEGDDRVTQVAAVMASMFFHPFEQRRGHDHVYNGVNWYVEESNEYFLPGGAPGYFLV